MKTNTAHPFQETLRAIQVLSREAHHSKGFRPLHKIHGTLRVIQVCRDWQKWFREYFSNVNDGLTDCYKMRCGANLYTRRNQSDFTMIAEVFGFRNYDRFGYKVAAGDVVVDIGAHIGLFSVYAATVCGASRVLCFEPSPDSYKMLVRNAEQNQLRMLTCVNQAVSGTRGVRALRVSPMDPLGDSLVIGTSEDTVQVECCTLEDIFQRFSLTKIDYLKMDCEGAEYEIFENATSSLQQIRRISMETHTTPDRKPEDLEKLLRSHGFEVKRSDPFLYARRLS